MFEWQKRYLTSERSEQVRFRFCHENIKFISLSQRVNVLFIIWRPDVIEIADFYFIVFNCFNLFSSLQNLALCEIPCEEFSLKAFKSSRFPFVLVLEVLGKLILFRRLIKQIKPACRCLLTTNLNDTRNQVHSTK